MATITTLNTVFRIAIINIFIGMFRKEKSKTALAE